MVMSWAANRSSCRGGAIMNRASLFRRTILMVIVAFFLLPLLTGCVDFYITATDGENTWPVKDTYTVLSCRGTYSDGWWDYVTIRTETTETAHLTLDLLENGLNPLDYFISCHVTNTSNGKECCGLVRFEPYYPMIYPVELQCGFENFPDGCGEPPYL